MIFFMEHLKNLRLCNLKHTTTLFFSEKKLYSFLDRFLSCFELQAEGGRGHDVYARSTFCSNHKLRHETALFKYLNQIYKTVLLLSGLDSCP